MAIQLIESICYTPIHKIIKYTRFPGNKVNVMVVDWQVLPITAASAELHVATMETDSNLYYAIRMSGNLKSKIDSIDESIFKIKLCSGEELIFGSPYIPVKPLFSNNLNNSKFEINYSSPSGPSTLIS